MRVAIVSVDFPSNNTAHELDALIVALYTVHAVLPQIFQSMLTAPFRRWCQRGRYSHARLDREVWRAAVHTISQLIRKLARRMSRHLLKL